MAHVQRTLASRFKMAALRLGLPEIRIHGLRHTAAATVQSNTSVSPSIATMIAAVTGSTTPPTKTEMNRP